jgi:TRAP-type C4-dicarboxylate transport system permease small subunit
MMRALLLCGGVLVVPLALLLFLQWPLRDWLGGGTSRQANDLGQILFAFYVAVAVLAASRSGTHLAAHIKPEDTLPPAVWRKWVTVVCIAPWAAFSLWSGFDTIRLSILGLEHFSDTLNPGYFLIKLALGFLLLLILTEALASVLRAKRPVT